MLIDILHEKLVSSTRLLVNSSTNNRKKKHLLKTNSFMSNLRFKVVEEAFKKRPVEVATPAERPSEYFAKYVFNQEKMFKYLPLKTYKRLR